MLISFPPPFLQRIKQQFLSDHDDFIQALSNNPVVSVRLHPEKSIQKFLQFSTSSLEPIPWCGYGFYLPERPIFTADPLFHAGCYYVQEASSMFLSHIIKSIIPENMDIQLLDLCAAPGGKSTLLNSAIPGNSLLVANEVIRSRAGILEENLVKWGKPNFVVTSNDPKDFKKLPDFFNVIVTDAPCSGEGMFRKDKSAMDEWSEANVKLCVSRQERIIEDVIPSLAPGGYLIYSTCTFAPEENEKNAQWIASTYDLTSVKIQIPREWGITEKEEQNIYSYHFYPHKVKGEGLFICCFQKPKTIDNRTGSGSIRNARGKIDYLPKKWLPEMNKWLAKPEDFDFILRKELVYAVAKTFNGALSVLQSQLNVIYPGLFMGKMMGEQLIPSHELALSTSVSKNLPGIEVDRDMALIYLKKGDIYQATSMEELPNGWALVRFEGHNLGWIKKIGSRVNNYYPKELRILKDF